MSKRYSIRDEALDDMALILALSPEVVDKVTSSLSVEGPTIISASKILTMARSVVVDKEISAALVRQALFAAELARTDERTDGDVVSDMFDSYFGLRDEEIKPANIDLIVAAFRRLSGVPHLAASSKAITLSFSSPTIFRDAKIISDLRPVFDNEKSKILGLISLQHLILEYVEAGNSKEMSLALDKDDIKKLMLRCEEALKKIDSGVSFASDHCKIDSIVAGEETYAFR